METETHLTCTACQDKNPTLQNFLNFSQTNSINVCNNCFHLQKNTQMSSNITLGHYNTELYKEFVLQSVEKHHKNKKRIKILNINDNNTVLLDQLLNDICYIANLPKTSIHTVSLSQNFNPSYFSKHKCYKDILSEDSLRYLKENYDSFDIIILNTTLLTSNNPTQILKQCSHLCNSNSSIIGINYYSINPIDYMNIDKSLAQFFNTNSLKHICEKNSLQLNNISTNANYSFYELTSQHTKQLKRNVISNLYNEITTNTYCIELYNRITLQWFNTLNETTKLLDRYRSDNYKLVSITNCKCCNPDHLLYNNETIDYNINELTKSKLNDILENNKSYVFISFNTCFNLKKYLKELKLENTKCLIYDIDNIITHPYVF